MSWRLLILLAALSLGHGTNSPSAENDDVPTVSFCELMKDVRKFDGVTVRVTATMFRGAEQSSLLAECVGQGEGDGAAIEDFRDCRANSPSSLLRRLDRLLKKDRRAKVTMIGTFRGPKQVVIPDGTSPGWAKNMQRVNSRWGHNDTFCCAFEPRILESVERVAAEEPDRLK